MRGDVHRFRHMREDVFAIHCIFMSVRAWLAEREIGEATSADCTHEQQRQQQQRNDVADSGDNDGKLS